MVSSALGADGPAYRVGASGSGLLAQSPAQRLRVRFGNAGVQIGSDGLRLGLALRGIGYGASLRAVGAVTPSASANRVSYARRGLREWYRNGPLGLEQGFTIPRAPSGRRTGPLALVLALSGDARATLSAGRRSIAFSHAGGPSLRYGDLLATDARGRSLPSWLELQPRRALLRVDTRGARYPLRIDPLIQQGAKLTGGEERGGADFGDSVALSADGNTALVGGSGDNEHQGAAWVFTRSGATWTQQGPKLVVSSPFKFGESVALSSDGDIALIGAPGSDHEVGAAWVFTRADSAWTQGPELTTSEAGASELSFGASVALSADGDTALIGSNDGSGGAAWVFARAGATWVQQGPKLTGAEGSFFGLSVALSGDGDTALIGGGRAGGNANGAAWVYTRSGATWSPGEQLTPSGVTGDFLEPTTVALSAEGTTALIGGAGIPTTGAGGDAWVYTRSGSTWVQQGPSLTSGESGETGFGSSVALSADGSTALIGGRHDDGGPITPGRGAAWMFARSGSTWTERGPRLTGGEEAVGLAQFGASVALSADASTALIGGPGDSEELGVQGNRGAVWTLVSAPPLVTTGGVSSVGTETATLDAKVNPNGLASTAYFQYGATAAYGHSTASQSVGSAEGAAPFPGNATGLAPETTYHYRVLAESSAGTTYGADQTFTTAPLIPVIPPPIAPVDTVAPTLTGTPIRGQALSVSQGSWSNGPTSFAYRWQRCDAAGNGCATLGGATGAAHILTQGDVGRTLRAIVTAANAGGSSSATSTASPVVGSQVEAAMTWTFGWTRRYTSVESLIVHEIPAGATVEVACHGRGCPPIPAHAARAASRRRCHGRRCKTAHATHPQTEVNLTGLFKRRHLGVGARITVSIVEAGWVGKSYLFAMRTDRAPRIQIACLAPGASQPGRGC
ncbi:MAG: hypothetical protein ACRDLF_12270 [Solirubrobacteraceae bacterium]